MVVFHRLYITKRSFVLENKALLKMLTFFNDANFDSDFYFDSVLIMFLK